MPFKSRKQKIKAVARRADFDITSSGFRWDGKVVIASETSGLGGQVDSNIDGRGVLTLRRDLVTIVVLCLIIISAQIVLSLTLL